MGPEWVEAESQVAVDIQGSRPPEVVEGSQGSQMLGVVAGSQLLGAVVGSQGSQPLGVVAGSQPCTMVGMVIKGPNSTIYGEDMCTPVQYAYCMVQYTYCTLAHVHTTCRIVQYMEPCR